jgi:dipeptidyl-peptidase-4
MTTAADDGVSAFPRQFARTRRFSLGVPHSFIISPDGERVLFLRTRGGEDTAGCLWLQDGDAEHLVADPAALGPAEPEPEAERVRRERAREAGTGIVAYTADRDARTVAFALGGRLWTAGTDGSGPWPVPAAGPVVDPRLDPAGRRIAYVTGGALHVAELDGGAGRALAEPEHEEISYGLAEHVAAEEMHRPRGFWWAPDGEHLLVARVDNSAVQHWWLADPANPQTAPRRIAYPMAGTANADVSLLVLDLHGGRTEVSWDRAAFEYLVTAGWDSHGPLLSVQSRDQRTVQVLAADPATGATSLLRTERDPAWVQLTAGVPARTESGVLIGVSDLNGSRRLVVGGTPVTADGVQVRGVSGTDGESVLFTASEEPTEVHLWRYQPGHGCVRLTEQSGLHSGSEAGGTLVQTAHTMAGRAVSVTRQGRPPVPITSLDAEPAVTLRITWLAAGDRQLRTALLLPSWHQPGRRLPVLMSPYGGPAGQTVLRARTAHLCEAQWFAENGFAVVVADGRGTPGRGPAWDKEVFGDTLSKAVEDQAIALHAAAAHCQDLDLGRVGIRGWSFGGSLAAACVIRRPDAFHSAVSGAAPSDQRLYDTHWRERFLGLPQDHPDDYDRSSPITQAAELTRPLLLVHGVADDNVVVAHTLRMSAALLAAGRPHRVLPLSGTHMQTDETSVTQLMLHELDFLRETLPSAGT